VAAALVVWGVIVFKINSGLGPKEVLKSEITQNQSFTPSIRVEVDSFSIQMVDRDPFLGTLYQPPKKIKKPVKKPPKPIAFIPISYSGFVQKNHSKTPVFVININTHQYIMKKGQTVDSVTLVKGNASEIVVRYKQHLKTIKRP